MTPDDIKHADYMITAHLLGDEAARKELRKLVRMALSGWEVKGAMEIAGYELDDGHFVLKSEERFHAENKCPECGEIWKAHTVSPYQGMRFICPSLQHKGAGQ